MRFTHPGHPGKAVRLAYCLNVHPAQTLEGVVEGIRTITLPLRERLAPGRTFGVGLYLPASLFEGAKRSSGPLPGSSTFTAARPVAAALGPVLEANGLDAFTVNAFPYGDFHAERLKERVFEPTWLEAARARWTFAVAWLAVSLPRPRTPRNHLSISTHTGMHSSSARAANSERGIGEGLGSVVDELEGLTDQRVILALEAEPRANCGDTRELRALFDQGISRARPGAKVRAHLGTCLDACHAAVEFESASEAIANAAANGAGIAKLQVTNAVLLRDPARNHRGREALFAMAEPRYLHQVTGRGETGLVRAGDLPEVAEAFARGDPAWSECDEWRCHFHVPIDQAELDGSGLETTRAATDALVALALRSPDSWGLDELHLEIETYTWDVLPAPARGSGALIDSLEREYRHALTLVSRAGWVEDSGSGALTR
ncbi:MAG TPA: metabolite traffic protein EboE [Planctomycetota bacterium]|nr:metabolite traffic protein EboE [Planctomycetota bacterium]